MMSARFVFDALTKAGHEVVLIGIGRDGGWRLCAGANDVPAQVPDSGGAVTLAPGQGGRLFALEDDAGPDMPRAVDVVFPVLHGPFGEDGTVQGLLEVADVPYVGAGVLGSAVAMDKDVAKRLLRDAGLPIARFIACIAADCPDFDAACAALGEIECAVLETATGPIASVPGEIVPAVDRHGFYSYAAKYLDAAGAELVLPAPVSAAIAARVRALAVEVFRVLGCAGMARIDFFLHKTTGEVLVNEANTIPGFTAISMYPKLMAASGVAGPDLVMRLVEQAMRTWRRRRALSTARSD